MGHIHDSNDSYKNPKKKVSVSRIAFHCCWCNHYPCVKDKHCLLFLSEQQINCTAQIEYSDEYNGGCSDALAAHLPLCLTRPW